MTARRTEVDAAAMIEGQHRALEALGPEAYQALYEYGPYGVLFTAPDGRVLAANPAACEILGRTEAEICALGRQGLADESDERWIVLLGERERTGRVDGVARMIRGDGAVIEVEMSTQVFTDANGELRTCTVVRDATKRVRMERELVEMSEQLRELTLTDELTGLRNRRGFIAIAAQMLEVAHRHPSTAFLLFLDVDKMKELNDARGHVAGDAALQAVARALDSVLRRADLASRIGGDEFVALALGLHEPDRTAIEQRIDAYLRQPSVVTTVGQRIEVSIGWATRAPDERKTVEDLMAEADAAMYRAKIAKGWKRPD